MRSYPEEEVRLLEVTGDTVRVAQLTDCHIFAGAGELLKGMDTRLSFDAVSAAMLARHGDLDLLLATGDLSQDGSAGSYRFLAKRFNRMKLPVFRLPGNHDDSALMAANLDGRQVSPAKQVLAGAWQILLLDSTIGGEIHGRVSSAELEFMDRALEARPGHHALVCLHHQAIETGSRWIDEKGLLDAAQFRQRVKAHRQVRAVLWGHVHQEMQLSSDGIEWMSTPSSCVQFAPGSAEFAIGDEAPGYRILHLHADGSVESRVHRVDLDAAAGVRA